MCFFLGKVRAGLCRECEVGCVKGKKVFVQKGECQFPELFGCYVDGGGRLLMEGEYHRGREFKR